MSSREVCSERGDSPIDWLTARNARFWSFAGGEESAFGAMSEMENAQRTCPASWLPTARWLTFMWLIFSLSSVDCAFGYGIPKNRFSVRARRWSRNKTHRKRRQPAPSSRQN